MQNQHSLLPIDRLQWRN